MKQLLELKEKTEKEITELHLQIFKTDLEKARLEYKMDLMVLINIIYHQDGRR